MPTHDARLTGLVAATLTPFGRDGGIDHDQVAAHAAWLVERGIRVLAPAGTTGEALYLAEREKIELIETVVGAVRGRAAVIAGIWGLTPAEVARLARAAEAAGADAVFLTTPIYYPHSAESLAAWYRHARAATALPLFAYNIPQYAANEIPVPLVAQLVEEGVIAGIKDSTGQADRLTALLEAVGERALVYGASDSFALAARRLGAHGFISALANLFPALFHRIWEGEASAQALVDRVRTATKGYGGIAALKHLLRRHGFDFGGTRLPFSELTDATRAELDRAVEAIGVWQAEAAEAGARPA